MRGVVAITTLIFGPLKVADAIINKEEVVKRILAMADSDDVLQQKVVCECIVAAVMKYKDKTNEFLNIGVKILEDLYQSKDDSIRVRALVGLCKMESLRYTSVTIGLFLDRRAEIKTLAEICKQFLINPEKKKDMEKWAIKGLSYLTFSDDVKNELIYDQSSSEQVLQAMIELTKIDDQSVLYAVIITLVNLCDAYEHNSEEMYELLTFGARYLHDLHVQLIDDELENNRNRRLDMLVKAGVMNVLVSLIAKTDSQKIKVLITYIFEAICTCSEEKLREIVVEEGGMKILLSLALDSTHKGKKVASRVLAYLVAYTISPVVAFPSQRMKIEVVRLFVNLLDPECSVDENCDILRALCNLARFDNSLKKCMFEEGIFQNFQNYMNKDFKLRDWFTKLIFTLVSDCEIAIQCFEQVKNLVSELLSILDKYKDVSKSVTGILMMLTVASKEACEEILDSESGLNSLRFLLINPDDKIIFWSIQIVINMMESTKYVARELIKTDIMILLEELTENDNEDIKGLASFVLDTAAEWRGKMNVGVEGNELSQSTDDIEHVD